MMNELTTVKLGKDILYLPKDQADDFASRCWTLMDSIGHAAWNAERGNYHRAIQLLEYLDENLMPRRFIEPIESRVLEREFSRLTRLVFRIFVLRTQQEVLPYLSGGYHSQCQDIISGYAA